MPTHATGKFQRNKLLALALAASWTSLLVCFAALSPSARNHIFYVGALGTFGLYPVLAVLLDWAIYTGSFRIKPLAENSHAENKAVRALLSMAGLVVLVYASSLSIQGLLGLD